MATRKRAAQAAEADTQEAAPESGQPGLGLNLTRSEGVKRRERPKQENPTVDALQATLSEGPLAYTVNSKDAAKQVVNLLVRAAAQLSVGLSKSVTANGDGTWTVDFEASTKKRQHKYTTKDVRAWAAENGYGELSGPLSKSIRAAYRQAHGLDKESVEEQNNQV